MNLTVSTPNNITSPPGNSLAVYIDATTGLTMLKDINGQILPLNCVPGNNVFVTPEQFGAIGDGVADDTVAIQNMFNSLTGGEYVLFTKPSYLVSADITFTASNVIVDGKNCLITETHSTTSTATITGSGSDNSIIKNFRFQGTENLTNWQAGNTAYRQASRNFVRFLNGDNVLIENIHGQGKRGNVILQNCFYSTARYNHQLGFFGTFTALTIPVISDVQYCRNVTATGGRYIRIENNSALQTGCIATFSQNGFNQVTNNSGEYLHDNGIYNSSGAYNIIANNTIQWVAGAGIKTRGNSNSVSTNKLRHVGVGISFTGDGTTSVDSYNTNGRYGEISFNDISDVFTGSGISIIEQDGYPSRDTKVIGNTIFDHLPSNVTLAAIRAISVKGLILEDNIIQNSIADIAVNIVGTNIAVRKNFQINNNQFFLCKETIRLTYVEESTITGNTFKECETGITGRYVNNSLFENNKSYDLIGAYGILLDPVYSCSGNKLYNNDSVSSTTSNSLNTIIVDGTSSGTRALTETSTGFQYYTSGTKTLVTGSSTEIVFANGSKASAGITVRSQVVGTNPGTSSGLVASTTTISNGMWDLQNQLNLKANANNAELTGITSAQQYKLSTLNTAPASATDTGTTGEIRITSDYIYVCIATNTWVRSPLTTW